MDSAGVLYGLRGFGVVGMSNAWKTEGAGITSLVTAETRGKAKATTYRCAREAGYDLAWNDVRAVRWPEFDDCDYPPGTTHRPLLHGPSQAPLTAGGTNE